MVQVWPVAGVAPGTRGALSKWHFSCLPPLNLGLLAQRLECDALRPVLKPQSLEESLWSKRNFNSHLPIGPPALHPPQ